MIDSGCSCIGHRLAVEEPAPGRVLPVPHIHRRNVRDLMIVQRENRSPGEKVSIVWLEGATSRRTESFRRAPRGRIAVVAEVFEQDGRAVPRGPIEFLFVKAQRVRESAADIGREVGLRGIEVEQFEIGSINLAQVDPGSVRRYVRGPLPRLRRRRFNRFFRLGDRLFNRSFIGRSRGRLRRLLRDSSRRAANKQRCNHPRDSRTRPLPPLHAPPYSNVDLGRRTQ